MTLVIRNDLIHINAWVMLLFRKSIMSLKRKDVLMAGLISGWLVAYRIACWFNSQLIHRQIQIMGTSLLSGLYSHLISFLWGGVVYCALFPHLYFAHLFPVLQLILCLLAVSSLPKSEWFVFLQWTEIWVEGVKGLHIRCHANTVVTILYAVTWTPDFFSVRTLIQRQRWHF